jgi:7,8-dihydroneopterin aldolase/epimerase/oxygenase
MGDTKNNMKINNSTIFLKDIRCYAYHGVAPQENLIGNEYVIMSQNRIIITLGLLVIFFPPAT